MRRRTRVVLVLMLGMVTIATVARGDGYSPDEARRRMVLPDGFEVQVVAAEPEIRQPVAACWDERGRLWVVEYLQYPVPAGLKPVSSDVYLRTAYDRVPEPPPFGPRGADRIKILEDTDGDGRADKVTTFLEGLNLASGIAVGHGGVFIAQAPYLLFYPDRDRDDRPDCDPRVLLSGFGLEDAHAVVNSLAWGPDGWLYGAEGSTVTAKIRGIEFQQGIWRYHPTSKRFELFAEGGGNTWGLDFDRRGQAFGSSNGGFIAFHMVQGAYYWKGFAKHGPLHNPRTFGYFDSIAYDGPRQGGHVTPGGIVYKADAYPEEFRGAFIGGNLLSNTVYWHRLSPDGSTVRGRHGGTLIDAQDRWFRPIDLLTGPDGCVYVVDWYDKRASHLDPRDNWDKTNGRIYRITYRGTPAVRVEDLSRLTSDQLVDFRDHPNDWYPEMARRILSERQDRSVVPRLKSLLASETDETRALRDLWALFNVGGLDRSLAIGLLDHPVAGVRSWTIRLLGDEGSLDAPLVERLTSLAAHEPSPMVRSQLAASAGRFATADALPIVRSLIVRDEDATDRMIPMQLWWTLERHLQENRSAVIALFRDSPLQSHRIAREFLLERLGRALTAPDDLPRCLDLLKAAPGAAEADRILAGIEKGLEGRRLATVPDGFGEWVERLRRDPTPGKLRLAARLGDGEALEIARKAAQDSARSEVDRVGFVDLLAQVDRESSRGLLLDLLRTPTTSPIRLAALKGLAATDSAEVRDGLIAVYPRVEPAVKDRIRDAMVSRADWADRLLTAMESGAIASKDLRSVQAQQLARLGVPGLTTRLEAVWGKVPSADASSWVQRVAEVRGLLVEGDKGNAARGRSVFDRKCAGCHRLFGQGATVGPDLTGAERNLDSLLENVVNPSGLIRKEYQARTLALKDGRVLTGLIVEEGPGGLTLFDSRQEKTLIDRDAIEESREAEVSLMPDGLLDDLPETEIRDLFRYLQAAGPP